MDRSICSSVSEPFSCCHVDPENERRNPSGEYEDDIGRRSEMRRVGGSIGEEVLDIIEDGRLLTATESAKDVDSPVGKLGRVIARVVRALDAVARRMSEGAGKAEASIAAKCQLLPLTPHDREQSTHRQMPS